VPQYVLDRDQYLNSSGGESPEHENTGRSLRDYFQLAIKYRWLIGTTAAVALALTVIYSFLATPLFTATATVKIGTYAPLLPTASVEGALSSETREQDYLNTQVQLLSSLTLAEKVLSDSLVGPDLQAYLNRSSGLFSFISPFKKSASSVDANIDSSLVDANYSFPIPTLERYVGMVNVSRIRNTTLVRLAVTTADPQLSARIANKHAEAFIDLTRSDRQKSSLENIAFLQTQSEDLSGKVAQAERNLAKYAEENAIVSLNKDENIVVKRMSELSELLTQATAKRIQSETKFNEAKGSAGLDSSAFDDTSTGRSRGDLEEAEAEYARLGEKFTPSYPRMVELRARIEALKSSLKSQRGQAVKGLEALFKADFESEKLLKNELEVQKSRAFELSRRQVQYNIMKRDYDSVIDLQQAVLRQLKEAQITSQSSGTNILLSEHAAIPKSKSSPRRALNILLALVFGPLLGAGLAFAAESLDNTVKTPEQAQRTLGVPTLGVVPMFSLDYDPFGIGKGGQVPLNGAPPSLAWDREKTETNPDPSTLPAEQATKQTERAQELVMVSAPRSMASEAFRTVRTAILLSSADNPPRVILVTSGQKSEGKTTLITNLAVTIAQSGSSVLLIDADLRRPAVHKHFGIDGTSAGLVDFLAGQAELEKIINRTAIENLSVITSGPIPPNPSELLGSKKMAGVLDLLSKQFDYIFVDAPPVLPVTDAVVLSRFVDGVVLVVRGQETQTHVAREAVSKLRQVGAKVLGTVLNDVDLRSGDYYYYRRGYYSYYREDNDGAPRKKKRAVG